METKKTKIGNLFKIIQTINKIFLGETHLELPRKIANWTSIKKPKVIYFVRLTLNLYIWYQSMGLSRITIKPFSTVCRSEKDVPNDLPYFKDK